MSDLAPGNYPLLAALERPSDLRSLTFEQLNDLASEIRRFVVAAVTRVGGHLGSNLGVVELTIALHRVFDSPHDVLLWDTGHQAYVHKLLTGRQEQFRTLRQQGGLSGYPSRAESEHDWIENSHASTVLSYADGISQGFEHLRSRRRVVAVIGDGSMTGGMAYEALNNIGHAQRRVLVVLNDNGRSYAPTISKWAKGISRLRMSNSFVRSKNRFENAVGSLPRIGPSLERSFRGLQLAVREATAEPTAFFETLGVRYVGPFDGHNIEELEEALERAADHDGPIVVHVLTQKGRGYGPAEADDEKHLHDVPAPAASVAKPLASEAPDEITVEEAAPKSRSWTQVFSDALVREGERDSRLIAITAAMPGPTGLLPFQARFPDRFVDVGIAEQHAVTMAAGLAMAGMRPLVAVYSTFLTRAFDQVNVDVGLHRLPVVFCLDRAGITGPDGASHHGVLDLALMSRVPGMTVLAPSSDVELETMLSWALHHSEGPVSIRFPRGNALVGSASADADATRAQQLRSGSDASILALGKLVAPALGAAELLAEQGLDVAVWDARAAKPVDPLMVAAAERTPLVVTVEDGLSVGGFGSAVANHIASSPTSTPQRRPALAIAGVPDRYIPHAPDPNVLLASFGLDSIGIAATVRRGLRLDAAAPAALRKRV